MKIRLIVIVVFLVISVVKISPSQAQGFSALYVAEMPFFPDLPQDTAYEGQSYSFELKVKNNTNLFINNTTVSFEMKVDSGTVTLLSNPQTSILPGDSVNITVSPYNFQQPLFKAGNNIVVVWPVVNGMTVPIDSFFTNVFFVPLNSVGDGELNDNLLGLHPNPVNDQLILDISEPATVEYVRIYASTGQQVVNLNFLKSGVIDVSFLSRGIYFIEVNLNGKMIRRKLLKQ